MDWSITRDSAKVNHAPVAIVNNICGVQKLEYHVPVGKSITLDASKSWDPDGDDIEYDWSIYEDVTPNYWAIEAFVGPLIKMTPLSYDKSKIQVSPLRNAV